MALCTDDQIEGQDALWIISIHAGEHDHHELVEFMQLKCFCLLKWKIDKPNTKMLRNSRIIEFVMNTFVLNKKMTSVISKYLFYIAEDFFLCISVYHSLSLAPSISPSTLRDECTKAPGRICRVDWNTKVWHSGFNKKINNDSIRILMCF